MFVEMVSQVQAQIAERAGSFLLRSAEDVPLSIVVIGAGNTPNT
jgi:hypothetical protein